MSNNYENLSRAMERYIFLKKDINTNTYYKYASYSYSNSKEKYYYSNIKGMSRVHSNK